MKLENWLAIVFFVLALIVTGCDEGMNMAGPVIVNPGEDPTTNGEIKQPDPVKPKPTLEINTVVQVNDGSVTVSGTSTNVSEGTKVTVVLGDDAITVKTTVEQKRCLVSDCACQKDNAAQSGNSCHYSHCRAGDG